MKTLHLKAGKHRRIREGHLWAFAGELAEDLKPFKPGEAVALCDSRGRLLGCGYVNPHSLIAVRLMTLGDEEWDDDFYIRRIAEALGYRAKYCANWEAMRLIYAEGDRFPGLLVDKFQGHLVFQSLTAGIESRLDQIAGALQSAVKPDSMYLKTGSHFRDLEKLTGGDRQLLGITPETIPFTEDGLTFSARPIQGQKSGFYLDQRSNRALLGGRVRDARVLDLFSYTGSWGLTALKFGAKEAVMVDSSQSAVDWGLEDAARNGLSKRILFIKADVDEFLNEEGGRQQFDLVVMDPPALVPAKSALKKGSTAFLNLVEKALGRVAPGGLLVSCSCSHHLTRDLHLALIGEAGKHIGRSLRVVGCGGHPPDHPLRPGHPESEYLSCWLVQCH